MTEDSYVPKHNPQCATYEDKPCTCKAQQILPIRGWLILPALQLVMSLILSLVALPLVFLADPSPFPFLTFEMAATLTLMIATIFVAVLFFRRSRRLPAFFIILLVVSIAYLWIDNLIAVKVGLHQSAAVPFMA